MYNLMISGKLLNKANLRNQRTATTSCNVSAVYTNILLIYSTPDTCNSSGLHNLPS